MKRSKEVLLPSMCRHRGGSIKASLTLVAGGVLLAGCSDPEPEVYYYSSLDDCKSANPQNIQLCESAYQEALREAQANGPKFDTMANCEGAYGPNVCYRSPGNSWFMPALTGFVLARALDGRDRGYYSQPRYPSVWQDGAGYGTYSSTTSSRSSSSRASTSNEQKNKTIPTRSRGGFGSQSQAKSSWSRSSSRSRGWGG